MTTFQEPRSRDRRRTTSADLKLLTEDEAAVLIGCSSTKLQMYRRKGLGPRHVFVNGQVRYTPQEIESWIERRRGVSY